MTEKKAEAVTTVAVAEKTEAPPTNINFILVELSQFNDALLLGQSLDIMRRLYDGRQ